ncbi:MAG: DUF5132 domain-containing protein [Gammaproteobacteria bacterium]|jgi:hypothetical protein
MAIEDAFKSGIGKGVALGIGAAIIAPVVLPVLIKAGRPLTRAAIKSGLLLYDKGRETLAELGEVAEDLVAEARAEIEQEQQYDNVDDVGESVAADTESTQTASAATTETTSES